MASTPLRKLDSRLNSSVPTGNRFHNFCCSVCRFAFADIVFLQVRLKVLGRHWLLWDHVTWLRWTESLCLAVGDYSCSFWNPKPPAHFLTFVSHIELESAELSCASRPVRLSSPSCTFFRQQALIGVRICRP